MCVEECNQGGHGALVHHDVGIGDQQVAPTGCCGHATIHAASVTEIEFRHDEHDVLAGERRQRRALLAILHDDDVGDAVGV